MENSLKYEEWFFQSDYDLETAYDMFNSGRNIYYILYFYVPFVYREGIERIAG